MIIIMIYLIKNNEIVPLGVLINLHFLILKLNYNKVIKCSSHRSSLPQRLVRENRIINNTVDICHYSKFSLLHLFTVFCKKNIFMIQFRILRRSHIVKTLVYVSGVARVTGARGQS